MLESAAARNAVLLTADKAAIVTRVAREHGSSLGEAFTVIESKVVRIRPGP